MKQRNIKSIVWPLDFDVPDNQSPQSFTLV